MALEPSVLFVSCTEEPADYLIKLLLDQLPESINTEEGIVSYPLHIDTKYYNADILLSAMKRKVVGSPSFARSVKGVVIYFDAGKSLGLCAVEEWLVLLDEYEPDIRMMVCSQCVDGPTNGLSKREIQEWCIKKSFELVELNPVSEEDNDSDNEFSETIGTKRIMQAFQANVWPNLEMKDRKLPTEMSGLLHGGRCESTGANYEDMFDGLTDDNIEPSIADLLSDENADFSTLFSQLASMKEKASALPNEERKKVAEQLVMSYWKAMGGDEDEILD